MPVPADVRHSYYSVPALPKVWYLKVQDFKEGLGLNDRQVVILALWALCEIGSDKPQRVNEAALSIRERYPDKRDKKDPLFSKPATTEEDGEVDPPRRVNAPTGEHPPQTFA